MENLNTLDPERERQILRTLSMHHFAKTLKDNEELIEENERLKDLIYNFNNNICSYCAEDRNIALVCNFCLKRICYKCFYEGEDINGCKECYSETKKNVCKDCSIKCENCSGRYPVYKCPKCAEKNYCNGELYCLNCEIYCPMWEGANRNWFECKDCYGKN